MSLRALGSLLSRRLSPRGIPHARVRARAQAETLGVATRDPPLRSLNTLVSLLITLSPWSDLDRFFFSFKRSGS
jgi:hypothetical protein